MPREPLPDGALPDAGLPDASAASGGRLRDLSDLPRFLQSEGVAGLSVAFTDRSGIRAQAHGVAAREGTALTPDSMLQAGSVSKAVTAYAAHRLAAQGHLDLDADVNDVLTSWKLPGVGQWQPAVSVRDLLAHVAGVSGSWGDGSARGEAVTGLLEVLTGNATTPPVVLDGLPGLAWAYSGGGYLIVTQVICDITGLALDEAMAELVLGPAGMTASTFCQPLPARLEQSAALGHRGCEPVPGGWRNQSDLGAVGLWTTPSDLVRFARAVNADQSVRMRQGHRVEPRMGSGVFLAIGEHGVRWWSHSGLVTGYASLLASTDSFSVAIMSNDSHGEELITAVFAHVAATYGPGAAQLTNLFAESIGRWIQMTAGQDSAVGTYVLPWGAEVHVTAPLGQHAPELHLTLPGQQPVKLLPVAPHRWRVPGLAGTEIALDATGGMHITQNGSKLDARRVVTSTAIGAALTPLSGLVVTALVPADDVQPVVGGDHGVSWRSPG
jgi:CubicO group peptidase (beta-lactamase class C family)